MIARQLGGRAGVRPFVFLTAWFALAAAQLFLNAVRPPLSSTPTALLAVLSIAAAVLAVVTVGVGLLVPSESSLVALSLAAAVLASFVAVASAGGQGQFMAAFYLLVLDLIAALALHPRGVWTVLVVGLALYLAGVAVNVQFDSPGYAVFIAIVLVIVTLTISRLVGTLRDQAQHDPLTGALNRHGLEAAAVLAHDLAAREGKDTAVIEIDLDHFKEYNDKHGHAAGDELLARTVRDWQSVLRRTDLVARIGGDEFVVVLPGASSQEAEEFVGRMQAANDTAWTAGVSTWGTHESLSDVYKRADHILYGKKAHRK